MPDGGLSIPPKTVLGWIWMSSIHPTFWFSIIELRGVKKIFYVLWAAWSWFKWTTQKNIWQFSLWTCNTVLIYKDAERGHQPRFMVVSGSFHHAFLGNAHKNWIKDPQQFLWQIVCMCKGFLVLSCYPPVDKHGWLETNDSPVGSRYIILYYKYYISARRLTFQSSFAGRELFGWIIVRSHGLIRKGSFVLEIFPRSFQVDKVLESG